MATDDDGFPFDGDEEELAALVDEGELRALTCAIERRDYDAARGALDLMFRDVPTLQTVVHLARAGRASRDEGFPA